MYLQQVAAYQYNKRNIYYMHQLNFLYTPLLSWHPEACKPAHIMPTHSHQDSDKQISYPWQKDNQKQPPNERAPAETGLSAAYIYSKEKRAGSGMRVFFCRYRNY